MARPDVKAARRAFEAATKENGTLTPEVEAAWEKLLAGEWISSKERDAVYRYCSNADPWIPFATYLEFKVPFFGDTKWRVKPEFLAILNGKKP